MTNSFDVVGSRAVSFSSVIQSRNAWFSAGKSFHQTICGFTCRIFLIGVINFFPVGTAVTTCRIFPINSLVCLDGTPFVMRTILCISTSILLCFSCTSSMHYFAPSTIQPSTSFLTAHLSLPDSNLFLDILSFPLCPDTCGCGNMLWIPCSNALDKWGNCVVSLVCAMCIKLSQNTSGMVQNGFFSNRVKNLLHSFVPHKLAFSRPSSYDILLPSNGLSVSVPTRFW